MEQYKSEKIVKAPSQSAQRLQYMPKYRNPMQQQNRACMYDSDEYDDDDEEEFGSSEDYDSDDC